MTPKSEWETPKLIVLGRGTPEEHVLTGCKNSGGSGNPSKDCMKGSSGNPCISTSSS